MLTRIFSPAQLREYKKMCLFLKHAARQDSKVKFYLLKSESEVWQGKLIQLQNAFFLKRKKKRKELFSININYIEQIEIVDGFLNIQYRGSYKFQKS